MNADWYNIINAISKLAAIDKELSSQTITRLFFPLRNTVSIDDPVFNPKLVSHAINSLKNTKAGALCIAEIVNQQMNQFHILNENDRKNIMTCEDEAIAAILEISEHDPEQAIEALDKLDFWFLEKAKNALEEINSNNPKHCCNNILTI